MEWKQLGSKSNTTREIPDRWLQIHYYEAFNVLFRVENALRLFVYIVLKTKFLDKWAEISISTEDNPSTTIAAQAKKRMRQAKSFGYLGYDIACPVMHLTSGELGRIMMHESYWPLFAGYFRGDRSVMSTKLDEIGSIRNSLAHFRPIKQDDVAVIKQNAKHALMAIEECIQNFLASYQIVPTNNPDPWYAQIKPIGSGPCSVDLYQSSDESWIRLIFKYKCAELNRDAYGTSYVHWRLLTLQSSAILRQSPVLTKHVICLAESASSGTMSKELNTHFAKNVYMYFRKDVLVGVASQIKQELEAIALKINEETDLVSQDHLAKGIFVHASSATAVLTGNEHKYWKFNTEEMLTPMRDDDPPEYLGNFSYYGSDFIAGSPKYPWMPADIAERENPFA
jgi:hypothetical protein